MTTRVEILERLDDRAARDATALADAAAEADGARPLSEHVMLQLRYGVAPGGRALLVHDDGALAGFACLDPAGSEDRGGELVVHPARRGRGLGRLLLEATLAEAGGPLRLWAHGDHPAAARLAAALGFARVRSLWQMRRPLADPLPPAVLPEGVALRAFRPGADEDAWLAVNARAFAHHPEQGAWTGEDLALREREPWFDPAGFFLAVRGDRLAGFHWTKVHDAEPGTGDAAIGEVYVVGIDPAEQGGGLGKALTVAGLEHLRARGLSHVMLYVDEDNPSAVRLYESLGFTRWAVDVMYRHPA
ncbi:mycothiol acetyltransferase [Sphaerisporangium krabiense]|uniref:Mycothiol acetyltransferase n=1 Tax=Sphaerisporangium krabiense TaxID=763782 RepID=A0A7W9DN98_9ACTN|nr:mycothiol synthase [Sphaerisporangium krabiense]MBB5625118.1 mycothiol synthase [Sphaerisporangium krabiense]GII67283.1 mycothiol acetyltransferase [Sphaerisporangium krabiense]